MEVKIADSSTLYFGPYMKFFRSNFGFKSKSIYLLGHKRPIRNESRSIRLSANFERTSLLIFNLSEAA